LTYLYPDNTGKRQVFSLNLDCFDEGPKQLLQTQTDPGNLSLEEQLRRERMRLFVGGIASFEWAHHMLSESGVTGHTRLLVPCGDKLHIFQQSNTGDATTKTFVEVYNGVLGAAIDPHLAPDGSAVAFVLRNDIYLLKLPAEDIESIGTSTPTRLTFEGELEGHSCGVADFIAQEEMDRYRGFWWGPDSASIVFTVNDESFIPEFGILHQGKDDPRHAEKHRYPFAGISFLCPLDVAQHALR
jgi:dipeptidyl-peptidase-4